MPDTAKARKSASKKTAVRPRQKRVRREDRERQIVDEAIKFFAEVGFTGEVRELARRIGVNQSLLYRFFENKEALIERVFQDVFIASWNPYWDELLEDRSVPLLERLVQYYVQYSHRVLTYEWVRLFLYAGLRGEDYPNRFIDYVKDRISSRVLKEICAELDIPIDDTHRVTDFEFELVSGIQADIFYLGVRKFVYGIDFPGDLDSLVEAKVYSYFEGAIATIERYGNQVGQSKRKRRK